MLRTMSIIPVLNELVIISIIFLYHATGWSDDSAGSIMSYNRLPPAAAANPPGQRFSGPAYQRPLPKRLTDSPAYHEENLFGYPIHQDPLFDQNPRPSWAPMIEERSVYDRPIYERPVYDGPIVRQDPVNKPIYEKPLYDTPLDDKPKYNRDFEKPPAYMKPSLAAPVYRAPNYVIKNEYAPAYDHLPTVNRSEIYYARPEYKAPVYTPQEYKTPRYVPPPYIAPPE